MKAHLIDFEITSGHKTYATRDNAIAAVQKVLGPNHEHFGGADVRYIVMQDPASGRWFPIFVGQSALTHGMHFRFHVLSV